MQEISTQKQSVDEDSLFSSPSSTNSNSYTTIYKQEYKGIFTPIRHWHWFDEDDFENSFLEIANGYFSKVKRVKFKNAEYFQLKRHPLLYSEQHVALKDPSGEVHDYIAQQYSLSREVNCNLLLHPSIINYIGGANLANPPRVGIVMELLDRNLREARQTDSRLKQKTIQLNVAKQIASGMNFLHSLNPYILHRDLRTPNILINNALECKIADFGNSHYLDSEDTKQIILYTSLIPPECKTSQKHFNKKGDVYLFGWILIELFFGNTFNYNIEKTLKEINVNYEIATIDLKDLLNSCLNEDPLKRFTFHEILIKLNQILSNPLDIEIIAQNNISIELLKNFLEKDIITPKTQDSLGRNIIHQCCIFGNLSLLRFFVNLWGIKNLSTTDKFDVSLAHYAARNGYLEILQYLQSKDIDLNCQEFRFQTSPLDLAIAMRHNSCIDFLIRFSNQTNLNNALLSASSEGNLELVMKLVDCGADMEHCNIDVGASSLDRATYNGHISVVQFLIKKGANINRACFDGRTAIWNAAQNGHKEIVKMLIENGAFVNIIRKDDGCTPLFIASQYRHLEIVKALIYNGAKVNQTTTDDGATPLFIASQHGYLEIVKELIKNGANLNQGRTDNGSTPLYIACENGHLEIIKELINNGVNLNQGLTTTGCTPLFIASQHGHLEIVKELIKNGANINRGRTDNGATPIYVAYYNNKLDIVSILKDKSDIQLNINVAKSFNHPHILTFFQSLLEENNQGKHI